MEGFCDVLSDDVAISWVCGRRLLTCACHVAINLLSNIWEQKKHISMMCKRMAFFWDNHLDDRRQRWQLLVAINELAVL